MVVTPARIRVLCLLFVALTVTPVALAQTNFTATLSGLSEFPPNASLGVGSCTAVLNAAQTSLQINCTHTIAAPTAAHIHGPAAVGVNAPVLFTLPAPSPISATWALTPADVASLNAGLLYVNVHTTTFPGGEIRGQIVAPVPTLSTWALLALAAALAVAACMRLAR